MFDPNPGRPPRAAAIAIAAILFVTAAVYLYAGTRHSLIGDEALHGRSGNAILAGDWHLSNDKALKPFFVYYALALSRGIGGGADVAGRVAAIGFTLAGMLFLFGIARRWFDDRVALLACLLFPFASLTLTELHQAKTEPFLVGFTLAAGYFATARRAGWAGFFFAMAFCTKQQAAFAFPLIVCLTFLAAVPKEKAAWFRKTAGRFALGAVPPSVVLLLWSSFTKDPFAWLLRELTQDKYAEAAKAAFVDKIAWFLPHAGDLLPTPFVRWFALAAVPSFAVAIAALVAARRIRLREHKAAAAAGLFAAYCVYYLLLHGQPGMTFKARMVVPMAPWLALSTAWALVFVFDRATAFVVSSTVRRVIATLAVAAIGAGIAVRAAAFVHEYKKPLPQDEVPAAAAYLVKYAPRRAKVLTSHPMEFSYYLFRSGRDYKDYDELELIPKWVPRNYDRELYLLLDNDVRDAELDRIASELAPLYTLEPVWGGPFHLSTMFRVEPSERIGLDPKTGIAHYMKGRKTEHRRLDCAFLKRLLEKGFNRWGMHGDAPPSVTFEVCPLDEPGGIDQDRRLAALSFSVTGARFKKMAIERADFHFENVTLDYKALLALGRLRVIDADGAAAEMYVSMPALTDHVKRYNRNLKDVGVTHDGDGIVLTATAPVLVTEKPIRLNATPSLHEDGTVHLAIDDAAVGGWRPPDFVLRRVEALINPTLYTDLSALRLRAKTLTWSGSEMVIGFDRLQGDPLGPEN